MAKILAHRGANKYAPQNTIPAFKKALEFDIDGFENDVHLTADGKIVVCHNHTVDDTSNGNGYISEMTFDELRKLDFGSYFSDEFKGTQIPLLSEFFDLCKGLSVINVEIKTPAKPNSLVKDTVDLARKYGFDNTLLISCFTPAILKECRDYAPDIRTALLYDSNSGDYPEISKNPVAFCQKLGCSAVHPHYSEVDEEYIKAFHAAGMAVNPWTVDDETVMKNLVSWGVDCIITNVPDKAVEILGK